MNWKEQQEILLLRQALHVVRRQVTEQLDAIDTEIKKLLPKEMLRGRKRFRTKEEIEALWSPRFKENGNDKNGEVEGL